MPIKTPPRVNFCFFFFLGGAEFGISGGNGGGNCSIKAQFCVCKNTPTILNQGILPQGILRGDGAFVFLGATLARVARCGSGYPRLHTCARWRGLGTALTRRRSYP
jgi:hypothetical protein